MQEGVANKSSSAMNFLGGLVIVGGLRYGTVGVIVSSGVRIVIVVRQLSGFPIYYYYLRNESLI